MIVVAIIALSAVVLTALYATLVGFPSMPSYIVESYNYIIVFVTSGASFVKFIVGNAFVNTVIPITLAYEVIKAGYKFVLWVAKKIPMFGVSD